MPLIKTTSSPIKLQLSRKLTREIKRGHAWVYGNALRNLPAAAAGSPAILLDNKGGREIGRGYYAPNSPIALRICTTQPGQPLDDDWAAERMGQALALRKSLFDPQVTNGYRLFNGEGDGLPGLVCDIYNDQAALKTDGEAAAEFWDLAGIAEWIAAQTGVKHVYLQPQRRGKKEGRMLLGELPTNPAAFLENGIQFTADLVHGQKTGFFLDQRDNRARIGQLADGKRVLNMFGYTGGFSVYAGLGGATEVVTVDQATPALRAADQHWASNGLPPAQHRAQAADAFAFLANGKKVWDIVILDPPSFASSEQAVPQARKAYTKLIAAGAQLTVPGGILAAASCSSHIGQNEFLSICEDAISQARRKAMLLGSYSQPADHPAPLVMSELRYLKFVLLRLD